MLLIVFKYLTPKGFRALTIFPFVFLQNKKDKNDLVLLNHEKIHHKQQLELLIIPFFIWYGIEFLWYWYKYNKRNIAYRKIGFEREAYQNEKDLNYLQTRSLWSFRKY